MTETKIKKLPHSEIDISGEIPADIFESYRKKALSELMENFELPGFRKGKVPENMFLQKVPEMVILEEMAEMAINEAYPKVIEDNKLDPIGRPEVSITKIAKGNPLCFTVKTAVVPEIKLPDYKKIAQNISKEKDNIIVTDEEVERTIQEIIKERTTEVELKPSGKSIESTNTKVSQGEAEPSTETPRTKQETDASSGVSGAAAEFNDEFVKTLGSFKDVAEFKEKLKQNLKTEKERNTKEKRRVKILDALAEKTEIDLPKIIIEEEKNKLVYQLRHDVERMGLKFDEYLKNSGKTEESVKKEWEGEAIKRAKIQLLMTEIGIREGVTTPEEELSAELKHLLEHNKDVDESRARIYLSALITNQKVIELLENQGVAKQRL